MKDRYIVRERKPTPKKRINKNGKNKFFFDVYDTEIRKVVERVYGENRYDIDQKRDLIKDRLIKKIFTKENATLGDAYEIYIKHEEGKFDKDLIDRKTYVGYQADWKCIKDFKFNNSPLENVYLKNISISFCQQVSDKFLIELSLRQNAHSWTRFAAILNKAATQELGVEYGLTARVNRKEFTSAKKRNPKKTPDLFKGADPYETTLPLIKEVLYLSQSQELNTPGFYVGNYYYNLLNTMLIGNFRISEIIPLEQKDYSTRMNCFIINKVVDIQTNIMKQKTKTDESGNLVFMGKDYTKLYLEWMEELNCNFKVNPKNLLFPSKVGTYKQYRVIDRVIKKLFKKAGFQGRITLHDFRSFGAVMRRYLGLDKTSQEHLRHASKHMTKLYERGKEWGDVEKLNIVSDKVQKLLIN